MTAPPATVRCAVYTRKSTEEGLQQVFNSLDAQREAAEAYIKSQAHEGWTCLKDHYDDGGFTGGNMPALKRLLADIEAGKVDCIVVYKVDRLSRSLLDFARLLEAFERHHVCFVSVTQQFNSASPMGRLTMNLLLTFAQFEREQIAERTRDKMWASRRRGQYIGGVPVLGYDVDPVRKRLIVNEVEAERVRTIFGLYLEHQALLPVVRELERRRWTNKCWSTRQGKALGGKSFTRASLHKLLVNVVYLGQIRFRNEIVRGEQPAIVDLDVWQRVQALLARNSLAGGAVARNQFGAMLKGILRCVPCGCAMIATHTTRRGSRRYRYYVCSGAQKRGWHTCPSKSIPAGEIERFVVDQLRGIGTDPVLIRETLARARARFDEEHAALDSELRGLEQDSANWNREIRGLLDEVGRGDSPTALGRLAELQERIRSAEARADDVRSQLATLDQGQVTEDEVTAALASFDPLWSALSPREQTRIVQLLVERVDYDGAHEKVVITFHATGFKALAAEQHNQVLEKRA
jgi:site-specific DNA recombinase